MNTLTQCALRTVYGPAGGTPCRARPVRRAAAWLLAGAVVAVAIGPVQAAPAAIAVETQGAFHTVFRWKTDRCATWHVPDSPARAYRGADGQVRLFAVHFGNRAMVGPTLSTVRVDCAMRFRGSGSDDPDAADDVVWLSGFHAAGSGRVIALGHAEFQGHKRPALCPAASYMACWRNAVVLAVSDDDGRHFRRARQGYGIVAALPYPYDGSVGRRTGYFNPSNIFARDGRLYAFVFAEAYRAQRRGACLLRAGPGGMVWTAWDGTGFGVSLSPAAAGSRPARERVCAPLPRLTSTVSSVVRHRPSGLYVGLFAGTRRGITGVFAITSRDLLDWSAPRLVAALPLMFRYSCGVKAAYGYPSLLAEDGGRNFDGAGDAAWLYLTRFNLTGCRLTADRDLVRIRVRLRSAG